MPQSRLPDINSAFVKYRNKAILSLDAGKYDDCLGSLFTFNGLLPASGQHNSKNYRVIVSTYEYNKALDKQGVVVICSKCKKDTKYSEVKKVELLLTPIASLLTNTKTEKAWICPHCDFDNVVSQTQFEERVLKQPYFLGVVPDAPKRQDGIHDRKTWRIKFSQWVWLFIAELEEKAAEFREDNWQKDQDGLGMDYGMDDEDAGT